MTSRIIFSILILSLLSAGCAVSTSQASVATATPFVISSTLPSSPASIPSETPLPPSPQPTVAPFEGTTSTQINVRVEPSTASNVLGLIPAGTRVEILGKDPGGNWLQIIYPHAQAVDGKGWVTAQYVTVANGTEVPVVGGDAANPNHGNIAIVQQQINVRSGPGTSFNSLGTLNAQDVVNLTGKDAKGAWLQIEFLSGPDGKGWVNAAFVQAIGVENLPIITEAGAILGTGTPTGIPFTPTPTVIPAWIDNDSQMNPSASVLFDPLGTHTLIYMGDVSAPQGDSQDWIQFTPHEDSILVSLECRGSNNLQAIFLEYGQPMASDLSCSETKQIPARAGASYLIHLQTSQSTEGLQYIQYTITIQTSP